jgi:hypothetical protein
MGHLELYWCSMCFILCYGSHIEAVVLAGLGHVAASRQLPLGVWCVFVCFLRPLCFSLPSNQPPLPTPLHRAPQPIVHVHASIAVGHELPGKSPKATGAMLRASLSFGFLPN